MYVKMVLYQKTGRNGGSITYKRYKSFTRTRIPKGRGDAQSQYTCLTQKFTKMKKLVFMLMALMALILPVSLFATEVEPSTGSEFVINLGTFTGIVTLVSSLVTQVLKVIPAIKDNKLAKIGISALVGILICIIAWGLQLTPLLENYPFYQVLIYGLAAGLSGCGFYDVIKAIGGLFKNKED